MEQVDWAHFGFPSFEAGEDGFPRPGEVARWYRALKKQTEATWTQRRLARELGITEKSVWATENRDVGLDSIALRRKLARCFNIPLILFGLASLEDEANLGQTIKQCRKAKSKTDPLRTQAGLAWALGITEKAVRDMENHNKGLDSITRRRVLAHLLTIPPAALGIVTLEEVLRQQQKVATTRALAVASTGKKVTFDLAAYNDRLKTIWNRYRSSTTQDLLAQITADIVSLSAVLPYVDGGDEAEVRDMLCRYHQLYAHILRDQGRYDAAIAELEKATVVAERSQNPRLLAVTLLWIGNLLRDRGDVILAQSKIEAARGNSTGANQKR
ncbi:MAG: hypothetical protein JOZ18_10645, partial [Chloroflexi bacterium]|nr:hypothetical protein [Chloroflexota bacterium]